MIPHYIKQKICQHLVDIKSFETLEGLKRLSKEWCHVVLSLQWEAYSDKQGPMWYSSECGIITCSSGYKALSQVRKCFVDEYLEYGHNFVKNFDFKWFSQDANERVLSTKCANLKSANILVNNENLDNLSTFIELNSTITNIHFSFSLKRGVEFGVKQLYSINPCKLKSLVIEWQSAHLPSLSFILDSFPNLNEIEVYALTLDDVSDIIVPRNTNCSLYKLKQYPNIKKFEFDRILTPKTNSNLLPLDRISLGILRIFPNLTTMTIKKYQFESENFRDGDDIVLKRLELPCFPLPKLTRLRILNINQIMATNFQFNCPNVRELILSGPNSIENEDYYNTIEIVSNSFPLVERLEFDPGNLGDDSNVDDDDDENDFNDDLHNYYLYDALFFHQPDETRTTLMHRDWEVKSDQVDLSFETPIEFGWDNLKELKIGYGYSPQVLIALSQFDKLEKLEFGFNTKIDIKELKEIICILKNRANESEMFPIVYELRLQLSDVKIFMDHIINFIDLFPALITCYVSIRYGYHLDYQYKRELCNHIKSSRPNLAFQFED